MKRSDFWFYFILLFLPVSVQAEQALQIMQQVESQQLKTSQSAFNYMRISSCSYKIIQQAIRCTQTPTIKEVETVQINTGKNNQDTKTLMVINKPIREQGIAMLVYNYADPQQADESWLYLSALNKVKRISSQNNPEGEAQSVFGSEFTTEDQQSSRLQDYDFVIEQSSTYKKRPVWIIHGQRKSTANNISRYQQLRYWIDQQRLLTLKLAAFDANGQEIKRFNMGNIEQINQTWLARSITVLNLTSQRLSHLQLQDIQFNLNIDPALLTTRSLSDRVFQQQGLQQLRAQKP